MQHYTRELHIDAHRIDPAQVSRLHSLGFADDHFTRAGGGLEKPAHHFSWEIQGGNAETRELRLSVFQSTSSILTEESGFVGYIESEVIPPGHQITFDRKPFSPLGQLPLPSLELVKSDKNKVADLHVKVPLSLVDSRLESEFERVGCYFVETPSNNRIYTIQFLSQIEAKEVFATLTRFFTTSGGATELTYEICDAFVRIPSSLSAPTVMKEGSLKTQRLLGR